MIDVIIPVLRRPHRVAPLLESLAGSTDVPYKVVFVCSVGDRKEISAVAKSESEYLLFKGPPAEGQYAKKINLAYRETDSPWLLLAADDIIFHRRWAEIALEHAGDRHHVVSTNDQANYFVRQGLLGTHTLVRRSYIDEVGASLDGPGVVYHEGYSHNFVDCELSVLARHRGVFVFARTAVLEHRHPAFGKAKSDDVYKVGYRDFEQDRFLFVQRMNDYSQDKLVRRFAQAVKDERRAAVRAMRRQGRRR